MVEDTRKSELIQQVRSRIAERMEPDRVPIADRFAQAFYEGVPPDDFAEETADNLYGAALAIWGFARQRRPGEAKVRVYTPRLDDHGWRSTHTVIEIVNDDMPFLVSSATQLLNALNAEVHLVIHPVVVVERDAEGNVVRLLEDGEDGGTRESHMQVQVSAQPPERMVEIEERLNETLNEVRIAVSDWESMLERGRELIEELESGAAAVPEEQSREAVELLRWLGDDHFTYLGYRHVTFEGEGDDRIGVVDPDRGLGVLRDPDTRVFNGLRNVGGLPPDVRRYIAAPVPLQIIKTNRRSRVHRAVMMDAIVVKRVDSEGRVVGLHLFVGLFSSMAYSRSPRGIPILRRKVEAVFKRSGFAVGTYDGRGLMHVLDTYPRDELFQISVGQLSRIAMGILHLQERQRIAMFPRTDPFERFVSCLVYLPREWLNTGLRLRLQHILETAYDGKLSEFFTRIADGPLARLLFFIETTPGAIPDVDVREVEAQMADAARAWEDRLREALIDARGEEPGIRASERFARAFPASYRDQFNEFAAVMDATHVEEALETGVPTLHLYRPIESEGHQVHFKIHAPGPPVPLSDVLPMIENMGLKVLSEVPYRVRPFGVDTPVWIRDFEMVTADGNSIDIVAVRDSFHDAFARVWAGELEDDGFNQLVVCAGLSYRQVTVLRAYCKYLRQARTAFSERYMQTTLARNPEIARLLIALFEVRFDPTRERAPDAEEGIVRRILSLIDGITNLDEDRIVRRFLNLVQCTLRTNHFQKGADGRPKDYLSLKLDSQSIERLPLPKPHCEIFVYSPRVEGVHLRGGRVARGGLRWSDRREDFRTEVLGLMKAQMTKNAVIVPVGSKGGFFVKRPPDGGREAQQAEGIECYRTFIRGLLDLTDNLDGDEIVPPPDVVRRDGDDTYLVVAADKGTATFSDIANGVARDYGFWLDDAFASGGSAGYDHKVMGITARGAWESVKRHFRELGKDIQSEDFTAVGCGDMSGDVFGNGMLLSPHTKLVAAFNHMHVFVDPDPDVAASFAERKRLFDLPRSSWADYHPELLSEGGAVFDRSSKSVTVSPQVCELLGLESDTMPPNDLIRAILVADVELLWLGGIGTYVKARSESDADVGDRANDALRIDGRKLRARVVGEGANLGMTQLGRIEYAQAGGRLNVDAIDNSAGVDCSDHEVNIKILLGQVERSGDMTRKQRDVLLERMTDEVAQLVLRDNYLQAQAISVTHHLGARFLDRLARVMRELEKTGYLNRAIEFLPDDEKLAERSKRRLGFTRPELSVLLSYSKIVLYAELLASDLPDDPCMERDLVAYFPEPLKQGFSEAIGKHRLRREIIATVVTNEMVNRVGIAFVHEVKEKTGMPAADIARAYVVSREILGITALWQELEAGVGLPGSLQTTLLAECGRAIERCTVWFLREIGQPLDVTAQIEAFAAGVAEVSSTIEELVPGAAREELTARIEEFVAEGAPKDLASRIARLPWLTAACDVVRAAAAAEVPVQRAALVYFRVGKRFGFNWLRRAAQRLPSDTSWEKRAVSAVVDDLYGHQFELTRHVFACDDGEQSPDELIDCWSKDRGPLVARTDQLLAELHSVSPDLAMLAVASRQLKSMSVSAK